MAERICISVLFCTDQHYFQHAGAAIASLLRANAAHDFRIFVCSEKRDLESEEKLLAVSSQFGNASITFLEFNLAQHSQLRVDRYLTIAAYLRLFLTEFLDQSVGKVLYLDCDVIVTDDIGELWQTDLGGALVAAVPEPYSHPGFGPGETYFNSGVLLIDVTRWRAANVLSAFLQFAEENSAVLTCHDQDILNHTFRNKVRFLDCRWNFHSSFADFSPETLRLSPDVFDQVRRSPPIVHFALEYKPWFYTYEPHYKSLYYEALALTPWSTYRPPDRTRRSIVLKLIKMKYLKERLRWYAPGLARSLKKISSR
jgi:lipopolysaccharide biosynthesis glycosyltransferase